MYLVFSKQEEKYIGYVDSLTHMLNRYHMVLHTLDHAESTLLEDHMRSLRRVIRPGAKRLNWNSLGINDFSTKCDNVRATVSKFSLKFNSYFSLNH